MASTTFTNNVTLTDADWFNDLNRLHYAILGDPADAAAVKTALGLGNAVVGSWVVAGGTADAITATYSPAITTLEDGQLCFFRATAANATTTPSFSPNELTARTITMKGGAAVYAGAIPGALAEVILRYNLANTRWELLNPAAAAAIEPAKLPCRVATIANITRSSAPNTLDGVPLAANDRILVKDQSNASQNGIHIVSTLGTGANGTWTRATDADGAGELLSGMLVTVSEGTVNGKSVWMLTTPNPITIGTTALTFERKDAGTAGTAAPASVQGAFKNLSASASGTSANVIVSADEVVVENSSNAYQTLSAVSLTIAGTSVGANGLDTGTIAASTWYSVWAIWNGTTTAGLLSLSTTAPTMPSGYTHKALVGMMLTDGTGNKFPLGFIQYGREWQYKPAAGSNLTAAPVLASGSAGTVGTTTVSVSTTAYVPSNAFLLRLCIFVTSNAGAQVQPNQSSNTQGALFGICVNSLVSVSGTYQGSFIRESSNIYWASTAAMNSIQLHGFSLNL